MHLRTPSRFFAFLALAVSIAGCPAEEAPPPQAPKPVTEADAQAAFDQAKKAGDVDALIDVANKYAKFPAGKKAMHLAVRTLLEGAIASAEKCEIPEAKGALARVAPWTADDPQVDEAYDETRTRIDAEAQRCILVKLDEDVKRAEEEWDFARAFYRIASEKEVDSKELVRRRNELLVRYTKWLDDTLKSIVREKSLAKVVGDKRAGFDASVDPNRFSQEVLGELMKRLPAFKGATLVFDKLQDGAMIDPPVRYWTFGKARPRDVDNPTVPGNEVAQGVAFVAVAKGKLDGAAFLAWAPNGEGDVIARLSAIRGIVAEDDARRYDPNLSLPEKLVGATVLGPIAAGSDTLAPAIVNSEGANEAVTETPLRKGSTKVSAKKKELRGFVLPPGQTVLVFAANQWKKAEVADAPDFGAQRVLVKVGGFEVYVDFADVRVKKADLPAPPTS